jgi:hypothetical protein
LPPLPTIFYDEYDADYGRDSLWDCGGAKGEARISLNETEFSLKQFGKWIMQPNLSTVNKWKKVWVAGFLEMKHLPIIRGQNSIKQL